LVKLPPSSSSALLKERRESKALAKAGGSESEPQAGSFSKRLQLGLSLKKVVLRSGENTSPAWQFFRKFDKAKREGQERGVLSDQQGPRRVGTEVCVAREI